VVIHNNNIEKPYTQNEKRDAACPMLKMIVNGASTISGPLSVVIKTRFGSDYT